MKNLSLDSDEGFEASLIAFVYFTGCRVQPFCRDDVSKVLYFRFTKSFLRNQQSLGIPILELNLLSVLVLFYR